MYTVDCLYLDRDALKLKQKLENNWKSIQSTCMYSFIYLLHGNSALSLTREKNEAKTHLK